MATLMACHECDLIHRIGPVKVGTSVACSRCGAVMYRHKRNSLDRTLALTLAGLVVFVLANAFPFLAFKIDAHVQETTLITGVQELFSQGLWGLAGLVLLTTILVPLVRFSGLLYVLLPLKFNRHPWKLARVFRFLQGLQPWSMMEVFMLGILVAIVKLVKMATIVPGISLYAFLILIFLLAASSASLDPHLVWRHVESNQ